jgi:hypothetical protein
MLFGFNPECFPDSFQKVCLFFIHVEFYVVLF